MTRSGEPPKARAVSAVDVVFDSGGAQRVCLSPAVGI